MTPAEQKARELVDKFDKLDEVEPYEPFLTKFCHNSKQCALIAVELIINQLGDSRNMWENQIVFLMTYQYWIDVKIAIENL